jgi:hypothetical protein
MSHAVVDRNRDWNQMEHHRPALNRRAIAVSLTVPALLITCSLSSVAAAADSPGLHTFTSIAVGVPDLDRSVKNDGAVDLYRPDGTIQTLTAAKLGLAGPNDGTFGTSVQVADLNGDKYPDLVVGAPGTASGSTPGQVSVLLGSAGGITARGATVLTSPAKAGDQFGAALAFSENALWIGAPGTDQAELADTGAVYRYTIGSTGKATLKGSVSETSAGVGGALQAGERFGEVLAEGGDGGVVIGIPKKNIGAATEAGQMIVLHPSGDALAAEIWNQNSPGVPGGAEAGDHFGASVAFGGLAVGIPGEDLGTELVDAGGVQTFKGLDTLVPTPGWIQTQANIGVPGASESGDQFGASVAVGYFSCLESLMVAVGVPGEDIGTVADAGAVVLTAYPAADDPAEDCPAELLAQGAGLSGAREAGDVVGRKVSTVGGDSTLDENQIDTLLIGAPGEDIGTTVTGRNAGSATIWSNGRAQTFGFHGSNRTGLGYGSVFSSDQ